MVWIKVLGYGTEMLDYQDELNLDEVQEASQSY
jgi:hypothetical protein